MRKTGWYSKWQNPVREGWYERDYTGVFEIVGAPNVHLDLWLQSDSGNGYWYVDEPRGQINDAYFEYLPWRGLSSNAEVSRSAPLLAQVGSTDGLVATRHGED